MFITKKKKIKEYLQRKADADKLAFDFLLSDYLTGFLKDYLASIGIRKSAIHIDWFDDTKCIGVQGRYKKYYMDLQIYPNEFTLSFDFDEAEEDVAYTLESKEQFYNVLSEVVKTLR